MANRLTGRVIYFDQFNADTTLASKSESFIVRKIRMRSVAKGDDFELADDNGNVLFRATNTTNAGDTVDVADFGDEGFNFGNNVVKITVANCTGMAATDGTDAVWFYMA